MAHAKNMTVRCTCGNVEFDIVGSPVISVACYCDDCQEGARQIAALPNASQVMNDDGGTEYLLYRKDHMTPSKGGEFVKLYKIKDKTPTVRAVATCCNTAMYLEFQKGHWFSVYRARMGENAPPLQMRIQTKFKPVNCDIPNDVPSYATFPLRFIAKLLVAKAAMLVRWR